GTRAGLGEGHRLVEVDLHALANRADLGARDHALPEQALLEAADGVTGLPRRDLLRWAGLRRRRGPHGVESPAIRLALEEARSITLAGAGDGIAGRRVDGQHVVAVDDDPGHVVDAGVDGDIHARMLDGHRIVRRVL